MQSDRHARGCRFDGQGLPWPGDLIRLRARSPDQIISHGDTALVMGSDGQIGPEDAHGLYVHETRLLRLHRFRLRGRKPVPITLTPVRQDRWIGYYLAAANPDPDAEVQESPQQAAAKSSVEMQIIRTVGDGLHEDLCITNHGQEPVELLLEFDAEADFVGPDEVFGSPPRRGTLRRRRVESERGWEFWWEFEASHRRPGQKQSQKIQRCLRLRARTSTEGRLDDESFSFPLQLDTGQSWRACFEWAAFVDGRALPPPPCARREDDPEERNRTAPQFLRDATCFESDESDSALPWLVPALERSRRDLHAMRLPRLDAQDDPGWTMAAGIPAYMAFFGRDVLLTSTMASMLGPEMLAGSLREMARCQGTRRDDWRDEMPGRMLHEARVDPVGALGVRPTGRYYGSLTSSSMFALAVAEYWRWTGDAERTGAMLDPALRALHWLDTEARQVCGFFHAVRKRSPQGLDNQTWKDSSESVVDAEGNIVDQPVATCEEQGIAYLAQMRLAAVLRALGRGDEAKKLQARAAELKSRFNEAYWLEAEGHFAMALDPRGRPVASLGSNALRCLASGIADASLAGPMIERAFADDLFSGWGMRTLASSHPAYNPYAYHRGAVWPVEHGPFALGLRRYGFPHRLQQLCRAQFDLLRLFEAYRLPECVAGHPRDGLHPFPAVFPAANSPQAWSAATPIALMHSLLGLEPHAAAGQLWVDPWLPEWLPQLDVRGLRVGDARVDLRFWRDESGDSHHEVTDLTGDLEVRRRPTDWATEATTE